MTIPEFRQSPELTLRMREILDDPVMKLATETLRNSNPPIDADPGSDALVSVRLLSQMVGYNTYADALIQLGVPHAPPVEIPAEFKPEY